MKFVCCKSRVELFLGLAAIGTIVVIASSASAGIFTVSNTGDAGRGSLRSALVLANESPGTDTIRFAIPGAGVRTITLRSPLPTVTSPVIIDGATQTGFSGRPLIELNGTNAGTGPGLKIDAGFSQIRALTINGFMGAGIHLTKGGGNLVVGCYIGTDATGTQARGNWIGVVIDDGSSFNTIGGTNAAARNIISGNADGGINLLGTNVAGNVIQGNYVGLNAAGNAALPNGRAAGISVGGPGANFNTIGGTAPGAGNVISGNEGHGVRLIQGSLGTVVVGNLIGTDATGRGDLGNGSTGVYVENSGGHTIGGSSERARNVIAGNGSHGVQFFCSTNSVVLGNFIGTDATGGSALANDGCGVTMTNSPINTIGGTEGGARNIISGNRVGGVCIFGRPSSGNVIEMNFIGLDASGSHPLGNGGHGVHIVEGPNNVIGITATGGGNVISGNAGSGVHLEGEGAHGNTLHGNIIGLDARGDVAIGNQLYGVNCVENRNVNVGGSEPGARNIISGNLLAGVRLGGWDHVVQGNLIGLDASGRFARPNGRGGILAEGSDHTIGGSQGGRNVISGNFHAGVTIRANRVVVQGNYIGTDLAGNFPVGNDGPGVLIDTGSKDNTIGGPTLDDRNVLSGNVGAGVRVQGPGTTDNTIEGNLIGLNATGTAALGNQRDGVQIVAGARGNALGGPMPGQGNIISGNGQAGVRLSDAGSDDNIVQGNWIGTDITGNTGVPNLAYGIVLESGASDNFIGGQAEGARNRIVFNNLGGILIRHSGTKGNTIAPNRIHGNAGLAINLQPDGEAPNFITADDFRDADDGPNRLQNAPEINEIVLSSGATIIRGLLHSTPGRDVRVDLYQAAQPGPGGAGEGEVYLGYVIVTTDMGGDAPFTFKHAANLSGRWIAGVATDLATGDSSEFSQAVRATANTLPNICIDNIWVTEPATGSVTAVFTITLSQPSTEQVTVWYSTADETAKAPDDYRFANGPLHFAPGETRKQVAIEVKADRVDELDEDFCVKLFAPTGATLAKKFGVATIIECRITQILRQPEGVRVSFNSSRGVRYTLERSTDMMGSNSWKPIGSADGTGSILSITDAEGARHPMACYRVRANLP